MDKFSRAACEAIPVINFGSTIHIPFRFNYVHNRDANFVNKSLQLLLSFYIVQFICISLFTFKYVVTFFSKQIL